MGVRGGAGGRPPALGLHLLEAVDVSQAVEDQAELLVQEHGGACGGAEADCHDVQKDDAAEGEAEDEGDQ